MLMVIVVNEVKLFSTAGKELIDVPDSVILLRTGIDGGYGGTASVTRVKLRMMEVSFV